MNWLASRLRSSANGVVLGGLLIAAMAIGLGCGLATEAAAVEPPVTAVAFAADASTVVVASQAGVRLRSWPDLEPLGKPLATDLETIHDLRFTPDGARLAVAGGEPGVSGAVEIWRWKTRGRVARIRVSDDVVFAVDWDDAGRRLVCGCSLNHLAIVDVDSRQTIRVDGHSKSVFAVGSLPNSQGWLSAGADRSFRLWRDQIGVGAESAEPWRTMNNHTGEVMAIAVRPTSAKYPLAATAGEDRTVRFWMPTIKRLVRFAKLPSRPLAICWTPAGDKLAAACVDGRVRIIDPDTIEILDTFQAVDKWAYCIACAPDGSGFVVGGPRGQLHRIALNR